jgi:hypothetical protein
VLTVFQALRLGTCAFFGLCQASQAQAALQYFTAVTGLLIDIGLARIAEECIYAMRMQLAQCRHELLIGLDPIDVC